MANLDLDSRAGLRTGFENAKAHVRVDSSGPHLDHIHRKIDDIASGIEDCKRRNAQRPLTQQIPRLGILGTAGGMVLPSIEEGFDAIYLDRIDENMRFTTEEWNHEL